MVVANKDVVVMEAKSTKKKQVKRDDVTEKFGKFEIKHDLECGFSFISCFSMYFSALENN